MLSFSHAKRKYALSARVMWKCELISSSSGSPSVPTAAPTHFPLALCVRASASRVKALCSHSLLGNDQTHSSTYTSLTFKCSIGVSPGLTSTSACAGRPKYTQIWYLRRNIDQCTRVWCLQTPPNRGVNTQNGCRVVGRSLKGFEA